MTFALLFGSIIFTLGANSSARGDQAVEELPPPSAAKSVLKDRPQAERHDREAQGWALTGAYARHYFSGTESMAEYIRGGRHQIVKLQQETPADALLADSNFLYYVEAGSGNRWAIGIHRAADQSHAMYFQPVDSSTGWLLWQRAKLSAGGMFEEQGVAPLITVEIRCGNEK